MVVKVKEKFEKTRHVKNNDKYKKYILRRQISTKYYDRILSNKKKSFNLTYFCSLYMFKVCRHSVNTSQKSCFRL